MDSENQEPQSEPSKSDGLMDIASSLRTAALLSRKRRRVVHKTPPTLQLGIQLDYGQWDSASPSAQLSHPDSNQAPPANASPLNQAPDLEDGQREEGEISDTEESPPERKTQMLPAKDSPRARMVSPPIPELPLELDYPSQRSSPPESVTARTASPGATEDSWQSADLHVSYSPFVVVTPTYRLDANHVRPQLAMNQEQYDTAKDIVLDLLGWGVPPEYLTSCGLSRQIIYYVFMELNLRLPNNLDTSDLIPYPTPEMLASLSVSAMQVPTFPAVSIPPLPTTPRRGSSVSSMDVEGAGATSSTPPNRSPTVKMELNSPSTTDLSLLVIEKQRRQELLARKAVVESRRTKHGDPIDTTHANGKGLSLNLAPSQSVDDFLKTIEPGSSTSSNDHGSVLYPTLIKSPENMDVDEPIPGLIGMPTDLATSADLPPPQIVSPEAPDTAIREASTSCSTVSAELSAKSVSSTLSTASDVAVNTSTLYQRPSVDAEGSYSLRRGSKRPVAADFVDFDAGPQATASHGGSNSVNGYANGQHQLIKRKTGSFAGISGMRRCVIELSDSEDDGDGKLFGVHPANGREYSPAIVTPAPRHPPRAVTASSVIGNGASGTSISATAGVSLSGLVTPALMEKEEEIKKMRQLIAEREEMRLRKLAATSGKSMTVVQTSAAATAAERPVSDTPVASLKSEDPSPRRPSLDPESRADASATTAAEVHDLHRVAHSGPMVEYAGSTTAAASDCQSEVLAPNTSPMGHEPCEHDGESEDERDLIVSGETGMEQVVSDCSGELRPCAAGDCGRSSMAEVASRDEARTRYQYDSPLSAYPLLRSLVRREEGYTYGTWVAGVEGTAVAPRCSERSAPVRIPDLKPLRQTVLHRGLTRLTARNGGLQVCRYEVPGGGVCRDDDCDDLHLDRVTSEPSVGELANYVHGYLGYPWNGRCDVHAIEVALEGVRLREGVSDMDGLVRKALAGLGIRTTAGDEDENENENNSGR